MRPARLRGTSQDRVRWSRVMPASSLAASIPARRHQPQRDRKLSRVRSLRRRSQPHRLTWKRTVRLIKRFLPSPRVLHPWPNDPLRSTIRQEDFEPARLRLAGLSAASCMRCPQHIHRSALTRICCTGKDLLRTNSQLWTFPTGRTWDEQVARACDPGTAALRAWRVADKGASISSRNGALCGRRGK
jgi:hypothetical protein